MLNKLTQYLANPGMLGELREPRITEALKEGENRFVSVLFADVCGFTSMSELLSAEVVHQLLDQLLLAFSERIHKYGGYVDKYEGDRIMAHFGSISFTEQNSRRAVYAGLELIDVINTFNTIRSSIPELEAMNKDLAVRVGINSGIVVTGKVGVKREGDFTVYGDAVNLASRMEENGVLQRVMVPEPVKDELEDYFSFEFNGEIRVKGKIKPISTWLALDVNHKEVSRKVSKCALIGRDKELAVLHELYKHNSCLVKDACYSEATDIVSISAPAGVGKTRLIREFQHLLEPGCMYISEISPLCSSPFSSVSKLLINILNCAADGTNLRQQLAMMAETPEDMEELFNSIFMICGFGQLPQSNNLSREEFRAKVNYAILTVIQHKANTLAKAGKALVLVFDDLHFSDEASLTALTALLKNIQRDVVSEKANIGRVLFILAYRDYYQPLNIIPSSANSRQMSLQELDEAQIEQMLHIGLAGIAASVKLRRELYRKSAGNPLFIEEWCSSVRKMIESGGTEVLADMPIPDSVASIILSRFSLLGQEAIRLSQDASIIGQTFRNTILASLELKLESAVDPAATLRRITEIGMIDEAGGEEEFCFKHQIVHQTIYDTILLSNKKVLHSIVAEIIEKQYCDCLESQCFNLAEHYTIAGKSDKAMHYLKKSEAIAYTLYMNAKLLDICQRMLELCSPEEQAAVMLRKAVTHLDMGDYTQAKETLAKIRQSELSEPLLLDRYILAQIRILLACESLISARDYLKDRLTELSTPSAKLTANIYFLDIRRQCCDEPQFENDALELLGTLDEGTSKYARLENIIGLFYQNQGKYNEAIAHYENAIQHAAQHKNILRYALQNMANAYVKTGRQNEALALYKQAQNLAKYLDDDSGSAKLNCDMGMLYRDMGEGEKALAMLNESYDLAVQCGNYNLAGDVAYNLAVNYFDDEDIGSSRRNLLESISCFHQFANRKGMSYACDLLGDILYKEGKLAVAKRVYERNLRYQQGIGDMEGIAHTYGNLGNIAADEKDWQSAEALYQQQVCFLQECGDIEGEGKAWYNWATVEDERNNISVAVNKVEKAIVLFSEGGYNMYLDGAAEYLEELKEKLNPKQG